LVRVEKDASAKVEQSVKFADDSSFPEDKALYEDVYISNS